MFYLAPVNPAIIAEEKPTCASMSAVALAERGPFVRSVGAEDPEQAFGDLWILPAHGDQRGGLEQGTG